MLAQGFEIPGNVVEVLIGIVIFILWVAAQIGAFLRKRRGGEVEPDFEPDDASENDRPAPPRRPTPGPPPVPPRRTPPPVRTESSGDRPSPRPFPGTHRTPRVPERSFPTPERGFPRPDRSFPVPSGSPTPAGSRGLAVGDAILSGEIGSGQNPAGSPVLSRGETAVAHEVRHSLRPATFGRHFLIAEILKPPVALRPGPDESATTS